MLVAAVTVTVLPLLVGTVRVLVDGGFALHGDDALIELHVRDIGTHFPLVGSYQRFGWNHPGPLLFYLLVAPYRLLGSEFAGLQAGALLVNAAAVAGIGVVALRRGGVVLLLWTLTLVAVLIHTLGARLSDPWEPFSLVIPCALLVFLAFDTALGRVWALPITAGVASLLAQAYAVLAPVAVALSLWGGLVLVGRLVLARGGQAAHERRSLLKAGLVTVAVVAVLWFPPLLEQAREEPGNLREMWSFFRAPHETLGVTDGYSALALQFDHRALWLGGDVPYETFVASVDLDAAPVVPFALLVLVGTVALAAWRREREAVALGLTVLVAVVAGVVGLSRLVGDLFGWILQWTHVVGMACWLAAGWCAYRSLTSSVRARLERPLAALLVGAVLVLTGLNVADAVTDTQDRTRVEDALLELADHAVAETSDVEGPVLVRSTAVAPELLLGGGNVGPEMFVLALERAGVDVVVDEDLVNRFGEHRADPGRAVVELLLVDSESAPPSDDYEVVATIDPLTRAERARRERIDARLRARVGEDASLPELRAAMERDPVFRRLVARFNAIEDAPPLTLLVRPLRPARS